jgi:hypothetical protein
LGAFIISVRSAFKARNCWFFTSNCCYAADLVFAFNYNRKNSNLISKHISRERINSPLIRQVIEEEIANTNNRQQAYEGMQNLLDVFSDYCKLWKLEVNLSKTKTLSFESENSAHHYACR